MKDTPFTADRLLALYDRVAEAEDAIPRLRRFVLDLAVRGKLVEQDPSDEPVAELLKRISRDKADRAVSPRDRRAAKIVALSGDEVPSEIPKNWVWASFGDLTISRDGDRVPVSREERDRRAKIYDYYGASGVIDKIDGFLFDKPLLLIGEDGANLINRSTPIAFIARGKYWVNNHAHVLDGISEAFLRYLELFINATDLKPYVTGTAQPKMNQAKMNSIPVALPPLAEQHRIVAKVDELMALCDRLQAARAGREAVRDRLTAATLTRLTAPETDAETFPTHARFALQTLPSLTTREGQIKTLRQTILNLAVRGKLVAQDPTDEPAAELLKRIAKEKASLGGRKRALEPPAAGHDARPFELPKGWEWSQPEDFSLKITDGEHFRPPTTNDGVYFLSAKDVRDEGVSLADPLYVSKETAAKARARCDPNFGDILIVSRGATCGRICRVNIHDEFCLLGSVILIKPSSFIVSSYLELALKSPSSLSALVTASGATAQGAIYLRDLKRIAFPLPPLAEQHRIVARVDALMALCDQLESSLTTATTTRSRLLDALLHEALDGAAA